MPRLANARRVVTKIASRATAEMGLRPYKAVPKTKSLGPKEGGILECHVPSAVTCLTPALLSRTKDGRMTAHRPQVSQWNKVKYFVSISGIRG
jgi:hypothetical protein